MPEESKNLIEQLRQHSRDLWDANSRRQAVDWMAKADELMCKAAKALEKNQRND